MLDKEIFKNRIEIWVAALRSKQYQQGKHGLFKPDVQTYCCLGVACEISNLGFWSIPDETGYSSYVDDSSDITNFFLTEKVKEYYGLNTKFGEELEEELINLNDSGNNFESIATWIETSYKTKINSNNID